jgi:hypothetical protein
MNTINPASARPAVIGRPNSTTIKIPNSAAANSARLSALRQVGGWS